MSKYLILSALLLGSAFAQTTTTPTTTTVSVRGTLPAAVKSEIDALKAFLAAGGTVQLLNASGTVIGTLNADGTVTLLGTATLADATTVRATAPNGTVTNFTLARDLSRPGAIKLQWIQPNGKVASLPLSAIVNRMARVPSTPTTTTDKARAEAEKARLEAERLKAEAKAEKERAKAAAEQAKEQEKAAKQDRPTKPERPNNKK